jgi:hypothetical protein
VVSRFVSVSLMALISAADSLVSQCKPATPVDSAIQLGSQSVTLTPFLWRDFRNFHPNRPFGTPVMFSMRAWSGSRANPIKQGFTLARAWMVADSATHKLLPRPAPWWASDSSFFRVGADSHVRLPVGSSVRVITEIRTSDAVQCLDLGIHIIRKTS